MMLDNKKIAIIGGGPGGLILARLLQMKTANVKVYERDINKEVRVQGATLDLHDESGLKALQEAGLMDAFKKYYRPGADKMRITDNNAIILYDQHKEEDTGEFGQENFRPEIDRGPLRKLMLESLQPGTVIWNSHIISLTPNNDGWDIIFQNGTVEYADIVIGADGANSKTRPFVTDIKPFYSGITVLEGNIYESEKNAPLLHELLKGGKVFAMGDSKTIILSSKGEGSMSVYFGFKADEDWPIDSKIDFKDLQQIKTWFEKEYTSWDDKWLELFASSESYFMPRPQYCMPLDQSWQTHTNITLIGDAAHVMPPYAGEGVNMVMLDALELSECLTNDKFEDIATAIGSYQKQMLARASEVAEITLEQTASLHSPSAMEDMLAMFGKK